MHKSIGFYLLRYAIACVLAFVLVSVGLAAFQAFQPDLYDQAGPGVLMGALSVLLIVPPLMPARAFVVNEARPLRFGEGLIFAIGFGVIFVLVFGIMAFVGDKLAGETLLRDLSNDMSAAAVVISGIGLVAGLVGWLLLWAGIKGELKKLQKRA